ncbi:class I SAM-dependent methyltransferase [Pseudomonadales bacterium]|nr:class I SAM-dependent methyltransferase [Pseudomonadales bacterium]
MNNQQILEEFEALGERLSKPAGFFWKTVNNFSGWLSLNITILIQRIGLQRSIIEKVQGRLILNIGSGDEFPNGCINTDLFPTLGTMAKIATGRAKIKFNYFLNILYKDKNLLGKADGIVFAHVLEHLPPHLSMVAIENLRSYLKPGGVLRISVPSIDAYWKEPAPDNQKLATPILAKNSLIYGWNHAFMYDIELLSALLEAVGFVNIRPTECGQGDMGELDVKRRKAETIYLIGENHV